MRFVAIVLCIAGVCLPDSSRAQGPSTPRVRLLVPAYFYPAADGAKDWTRLLASSSRVPIVAIVNPASGPGKQADANYVKILVRAKETKITLLGYVTTSYAKRPLDDVKADIDRWIQLYPGIHGIFFDEQASAAEHVDYQATLYDHVRRQRKLKLVITNPGTTCDEQYVSRPATDAVCLFEGAKAFDKTTLPEWAAKHPLRSVVLSYKVGTAPAMRQCIQAAREKKIGYCFVTDAEGANPWDRLPRYWDEEVAAVSEANR